MVAGVIDRNRHVEGLTLSLTNTTGLAGDISYSAHVAGIGWQPFVAAGDLGGTTGKSTQMEAYRVVLSGDLGNAYDVWYRANVAGTGWLDWAKNGAPAGTSGMSKALIGLEVRVLPKNATPLRPNAPFLNPRNKAVPDTYALLYSTYVNGKGWVTNVRQNVTGGTTGESRSLGAVRFDSLTSVYGTLGVTCTANSRGLGWLAPVSVGAACGTANGTTPLDGLKLNLSGPQATKYSIYYKAHVANVGWQDWVKDGAQAGTPGTGNAIEAVITKLVPKT
jgi:uncharacterized protein YjdB